MAARMKSLVTVREEKAMGAVDMNRMLTAGMGTGFVYAMCETIKKWGQMLNHSSYMSSAKSELDTSS